jgi:uncharacterized protein (DUF2141 family)
MKFLALTFFSYVIAIASAAAADITITVQGIRNNTGKIAALAFVNVDGFPDRVALAKAQSQVNARKGAVTLVLKNVPAGKVALTILHDEDGDGKLKRNIIGIPQEGVGMTGKPLGNRAPRFEEAVIEIKGDEKREITLKYW